MALQVCTELAEPAENDRYVSEHKSIITIIFIITQRTLKLAGLNVLVLLRHIVFQTPSRQPASFQVEGCLQWRAENGVTHQTLVVHLNKAKEVPRAVPREVSEPLMCQERPS